MDSGTDRLNATRASWPGFSEILLPPNASDQPLGTLDPRPKVSALQPEELLFFTVTPSWIAEPCATVTNDGDREIVGMALVHAGGAGGTVAGTVTVTVPIAVAP